MDIQQCNHERNSRFMGHPRGLGILATGNFFNSFAWCGVVAILIYYLYTPYTRGLGFIQDQAARMIAVMGACNFTFTIVGSWLTDRFFDAQKAFILDDVVKIVAFLLLAVPVVILQWERFFEILILLLMSHSTMRASSTFYTSQLFRYNENVKRDTVYMIHAIKNNLVRFILLLGRLRKLMNSIDTSLTTSMAIVSNIEQLQSNSIENDILKTAKSKSMLTPNMELRLFGGSLVHMALNKYLDVCLKA